MAIFDKVVGAIAQATQPLFRNSTTPAAGRPVRASEVVDQSNSSNEPDVTNLPEGMITPWFGDLEFGHVESRRLRNFLPEKFVTISDRSALDQQAPFVAPFISAVLGGLSNGIHVSFLNNGSGVTLECDATGVNLVRSTGSDNREVVATAVVTDNFYRSHEALFMIAADSISVWAVPDGDLTQAYALAQQGNEDGFSAPTSVDMSAQEWLKGARFTVKNTAEIDPHSDALNAVTFRAGYTGYVGLRDPQWVSSPTGKPVYHQGRRLLSMTCAGPGHFPTAHFGIFSVDETSTEGLLSPQLESLHYFVRDNRVLGDHCGSVTVDKVQQTLLLSTRSTFGTNPLQLIRVTSTLGSGLYAGVHVHEPVPFAVPSLFDVWGPSPMRVNKRWYLSFVECLGYEPQITFRPTLAVGEQGGDISGPYRRIGTDAVHLQTEGTLLTKFKGQTYLFASDGNARDYPVYDLNMKRVAQLNAPYGSNIPHYLLVQVTGQPLRALSFDGSAPDDQVCGYGSHGDLVLHEQRQPSQAV